MQIVMLLKEQRQLADKINLMVRSSLVCSLIFALPLPLSFSPAAHGSTL
jgi:hypothetical protein